MDKSTYQAKARLAPMSEKNTFAIMQAVAIANKFATDKALPAAIVAANVLLFGMFPINQSPRCLYAYVRLVCMLFSRVCQVHQPER